MARHWAGLDRGSRVSPLLRRTTRITIAWLVAAVLFAAPLAVIASCEPGEPAPSPAVVLDLDGHDPIALHDADGGAPTNPCQKARPYAFDGSPSPAQRLPDDALIVAIGSSDAHGEAVLPAPVVARFPGLSPPPESPPPQRSAR
jgi:hypothetical protein